MRLSVLLRIAESLDRSRAGAIKHARVRRKAGYAMVELRSQQDCHLEVWSAETHRKAFQKAFGRKMRLRLRKSTGASA